MKTILNRLTTVLICTAAVAANAQTEGSSFTLTGMGVATPFAMDYQCLGINPGNLDVQSKYDKMITMGMFEGGVSLYSAALTKEELRQNIFQEDIETLSRDDQRYYAAEFANSANAVDVDFSPFGMSVRTSKLGTFAFKTRDRANLFYELGPQISEIVWLGNTASYFDSLVVVTNGIKDTIANSPNLDEATLNTVVSGYTPLDSAANMTTLLQGTKFRMSWVREFNLGWGKKLWSNDNLAIHAGLGVKMMIGQGLLAIDARDGSAEVFSALSPVFDIDYGDIAQDNPSALPSDARSLQPVGFGVGFDLGATVVIKEKFTVSAAVNDIGSMKWDGNVYTLKETKLTTFSNEGLESVNFMDQISALNGGDALLEWQGTGGITTKLPTTLRLGAGFQNFPSYKFGIDIVAPLNDDVASMEKAVIAVGGEFSPMKWIHLQAGYVTGGNYDTKVPVGIYFTVGERGGYEFGVSSRDVITFFSKNQPTISMAFGFLRFRF